MNRIMKELKLLARSVVTEVITLIIAIIILAIFFKPIFLFWLEFLT